MDSGAVFEQEEVPEEGRRVPAEPALAVRGPDVLDVPDRFLGAVVEIVAETGSDLGLELDSNQELAVGDDQQIPVLLRPVVPGDRQRGTGADISPGQAGAEEDIGKERSQRAHLGSAGDRAAGAGVDPPRVDLLLLLAAPRIPERLHGFLETFREVC